MICTNCKAGADLRARTEPHIVRYALPATLTEVADVLDKAVEAGDTGGAEQALTVATALRRANELHTACTGGEAGCPCQHRGTPAERLPAGTTDRPTALVTAPEVSA